MPLNLTEQVGLAGILDVADAAYDNGGAIKRALAKPGVAGDTLALFIGRELESAYDADLDNSAKFAEARRAIETARRELERVENALRAHV